MFRYGLSYITFNYYSGWARYSYRTAFISAAITYGIVVYKAYNARARGGAASRQNVLALAGDENVQYMGKEEEENTNREGNRGDGYANALFSHGSYLALRLSGPARSPPLRRLLGFPCRNLHAREPHPHHFTCQTLCYAGFPGWSPQDQLSTRRYHWPLRETVL